MSAQRRLRVAIISKADASGGGASRVAELSAQLFAPHYDVKHFVLYSRDTTPPRYQLRHFPGLSWFERECEKASNWFGVPDHISIDWLIFALRTRLKVDLIHCHDISSALSPLSMRLLSKVAPIAWTLHDMSPFTGGCLYAMECRSHEQGHECGPCPQLGRWPLTTRTDRTGWMQRNRRALGQGAVFPVCPSRWMGEMAMRSGVFANEPQVIPNYVDPTVFQPHAKELVRLKHGMPQDRFTVLLSSHSLTDTRKGFQLAAAALDSIRDLNPVVLLVGRAGVEVKNRLKGLEVVTAGYVEDERLLSTWYASADVLLCPTLADNLPNVIMETMACGTPTIGFATGGVPDMVEHDRTGWLAPTGDIAGLVAGLRVAAPRDQRWTEWRRQGVADARDKYSPARFMQAHARLYERLTGVPAPAIGMPALPDSVTLAI